VHAQRDTGDPIASTISAATVTAAARAGPRRTGRNTSSNTEYPTMAAWACRHSNHAVTALKPSRYTHHDPIVLSASMAATKPLLLTAMP
jgi:hypothetical protein